MSGAFTFFGSYSYWMIETYTLNPTVDNPANTLLGLFSGNDFEILDFRPLPMTFGFEKEISILLWTPPSITLVLSFGASVTVEYALVSNVLWILFLPSYPVNLH